MLRFYFCFLTKKKKSYSLVVVVIITIIVIISIISECFISPKINAQLFEGWVISESGLQTLHSHEVHSQLLSSPSLSLSASKPKLEKKICLK